MGKVYFFLLLLLLSGCATSSKDFSPSSIDERKEGIIIGSFHIDLNDKDETENCRIILNKDDRTFVKLEKDGLVFARATKGKVDLIRIVCLEGGFGGENVIREFESGEVGFNNIGNGSRTYFGHVEIKWRSKKVGAWKYLLGGAVAGAMAAKGQNTLEFAIKVEDRSVTTLERYKNMIKEKKVMKDVKDLIIFDKKYLAK